MPDQESSRPHLSWVLVVLLTCCLANFAMPARGLSAPVTTQETVNMTKKEKQSLVRQSVAYYEQGDKAKAREGLEQAQKVFPENYAVPYYLGMIYLEQGDRAAAIAQWQQYVQMDPQSENALKIRKNLTLLLRREARDFARQAVAREGSRISGRPDDKTVAVTNFSNLGSKSLGPLGKGMAAMLISDLSKVPDLQVVDRIRLQALLEEMKLGTSGLVNIKTAPRVGRLLGAKHVTSGSLADLEKETLMIASAVVDSNRKTSIGAQEAQGMLARFYNLEKQIACQMISDLGRKCDKMPDGFYKVHTRSVPALVAFSWGLDHFDRENYDQASEMFQKALDEDPRFDLAEQALLATPTSAMLSMNTTQMISTAYASAPASAAAGTAIAGPSAGGTVAASSVGTESSGISRTTAIVAGVAVVGGGVALAAGGGGGGGDSGQQPASGANLSGDWRGTWIDNGDGSSGEAIFVLTQSGSSVSGTVSVSGDDCLSQGNVSGTISGTSASLTITSGAESVALNVTADTSNASAMTLTGDWNYTASSLGCEGDAGNLSATITGGVGINW